MIWESAEIDRPSSKPNIGAIRKYLKCPVDLCELSRKRLQVTHRCWAVVGVMRIGATLAVRDGLFASERLDEVVGELK